jgi:hypothetical protein
VRVRARACSSVWVCDAVVRVPTQRQSSEVAFMGRRLKDGCASCSLHHAYHAACTALQCSLAGRASMRLSPSISHRDPRLCCSPPFPIPLPLSPPLPAPLDVTSPHPQHMNEKMSTNHKRELAGSFTLAPGDAYAASKELPYGKP